MPEFRPLFPPFLEMGAPQTEAVKMLQSWLLLLGYNSKFIVADGDFGQETLFGLQRWQMDLGVDPDGKFGPATRDAIKAKTGLDVNAIPA